MGGILKERCIMTARRWWWLAVAGLLVAGCAASDAKAKKSAITMDQTPVTVRLGIEKEFPDSKVQKIEKEVFPDGALHYRVNVLTKDGQPQELYLAPDGERLEKP